MDYSRPYIKLVDDQVIDARIEEMLSCVIQEAFDDPTFDLLFQEIISEYLQLSPLYNVSLAMNINVNFTLLPLAMGFDMLAITPKSHQWPVGDFDFMPDAIVAVALVYERGEKVTSLFPGRNINAAIVGALLQLAREKASLINDEPEFRF
jgi:hypothetical protein